MQTNTFLFTPSLTCIPHVRVEVPPVHRPPGLFCVDWERGDEYRRSSGYNGFDLRCFEVTNAPHKSIKDNNIEAVKLDFCDQELQ